MSDTTAPKGFRTCSMIEAGAAIDRGRPVWWTAAGVAAIEVAAIEWHRVPDATDLAALQAHFKAGILLACPTDFVHAPVHPLENNPHRAAVDLVGDRIARERQEYGIHAAMQAAPQPLHKRRWSLVPMRAVSRVVDVLTQAAAKHGDVTYLQGGDDRDAIDLDAAMRHVERYFDGERADAESHQHPLAHAAARLLMIVERDERAKS